jgi:photosystem II stability/assembly factor-like uncharacterized protein
MMQKLKVLPVMVLLTLLAAACTGQSAAPSITTQAPPTQTSIPTEAPASTPAETPTTQPTATPGGAWISLSPDSGAPGSTIEISGYLPGGPAQSDVKTGDPAATANVCWQGCLDGFVNVDIPINWSANQPGNFTLQYTVPSTPWLGTDGPHALQPGDYTIGLQCLGPENQGCAIQEGSVTATFNLSGPASSQCQTDQDCARLSFDPASAAPGVQVQVSGWAPLNQIIDGTPFGYNLAVLPQGQGSQPVQIGQITQDMTGNIAGTFTVPQQLPGIGTLAPGQYGLALQALRSGPNQPPLQAVTNFEIANASSWDVLKPGNPMWIQPSANLISPEVTADPANPQHLAYCAPGEVRLSQDGGKTWTTVSTDSAVAAAGDSYSFFAQGGPANQPTCISVTLDSAHPDSIFAVFQTANKSYGAPPVFFMGFVSKDSGKTWTMVPAPAENMAESFGGFWTDGNGTVQALFNAQNSEPGGAALPSIEQTADGGQTWNPGSLTCPASEPCLRWGAAPGSIPGMGSPLPQAVFASQDGGKTWTTNGPTVELREMGPHELVAFSDKQAVLLAGSSEYPVQYTQDGGLTWQVGSLPSLPGSDTSTGFTFSGLQILPDGSLVALSGDGTTWYLLAPGTQSWCPMSQNVLSGTTGYLQASGNLVFWISPDTQKLESTQLSGFVCGG